MKKGIVLLISLFVIVGLVYSVPSDEQIRQAARTLEVPFADLKQFVQSYQTKSVPSGTIEITARDISQEFQNNRLRATNKYNGTTLKITGRVYDIKQNYSGDYYLAIVGTSEVYGVYVYFQSSEINRMANLDSGQTVTIIGKFKEFDGYDVQIIDALLL
jgi:archaellum component FlaF (FlaF/FlaG flagellin family)